MEDFWKSVQTIQAERGADYRAFSLFSATHWAELLGAAAVIFLCAVIYYRCREVTRHQILRAVFVLMLADEFMKQAVLLYTGQWNVTYLPLHLCSINIFVCWYDAIHQSRWSKEILYALCIPGAVVAMLSPSWQRLPVWNLLHLHSYSIHVLLILYPVLLLAGGFRPQVHHIRWVPRPFDFCFQRPAGAWQGADYPRGKPRLPQKSRPAGLSPLPHRPRH